jgi:hypothetical protein
MKIPSSLGRAILLGIFAIPQLRTTADSISPTFVPNQFTWTCEMDMLYGYPVFWETVMYDKMAYEGTTTRTIQYWTQASGSVSLNPVGVLDLDYAESCSYQIAWAYTSNQGSLGADVYVSNDAFAAMSGQGMTDTQCQEGAPLVWVSGQKKPIYKPESQYGDYLPFSTMAYKWSVGVFLVP